MCFSASASFGAGVVLTAIGVASIKKTHHRSQLLFASIPFLFGVQQIAEGILWLTLHNPDYLGIQKITTYIFLFFAQILWPIMVPVSILILEKNLLRKKTQQVLVGIGIIVGAYLGYCLFSFHVKAEIIGHHIIYLQDYPTLFNSFSFVIYTLATILPPFFSPIKRMWMLGVSILVSYVATAIFYEHYILSVWCFFAAIISLSIYAIMIEISNIQKKEIALLKSN
jgi:hypothetical protein